MIPTVCAKCGQPVSSDEEFCEYCGAPLTPIVGAEPVDSWEPHLEPLPDESEEGLWEPRRVVLVAFGVFVAAMVLVALLLLGILGVPHSTTASSQPETYVPKVVCNVTQGTGSGGEPWFEAECAPSEIAYSGAPLNITAILHNTDTANHTLYGVTAAGWAVTSVSPHLECTVLPLESRSFNLTVAVTGAPSEVFLDWNAIS